MSKITSIKPQKSGKRVNIFLDGKFGFGLDLETFMKHNFKVEEVLSEEEVGKIIKEGEFQKVYEKILRFATLRPRSEKEFRNWLAKHKVHKSLYEELFNRLKRIDFLNDRKFASWWIDQRLQFKSKSVRVLRLELRGKGINKDIIEDVLEETRVDEALMAKKLLSKKAYKWEKLSDFEARKKKSELLLRNGFSWNVVREVLKAIDESG